MTVMPLGLIARRELARFGARMMRPIGGGHGGEFSLAYLRSGPREGLPFVVIPGGPGLASAVPFGGFRRRAARAGLNVLMVEHRGVGLSGRTADGKSLPIEAVTVEAAADDIAAVLDAEGISQAVLVGSSYGSYLAQAVAARHPEKVHSLILDSPIFHVEEDLAMNREFRTKLLWEGNSWRTRDSARIIRQLVEAGEAASPLTRVVETVYSFAGAEALYRVVKARQAGRLGLVWKVLASAGREDVGQETEGISYYMEPAAVAGLAFGQLGYGIKPDGTPLDPQHAYAAAARKAPEYRGQPFNFPELAKAWPWQTVVISGKRDLVTTRPVAQRIVATVPDGLLIALNRMAHSALDSNQAALIRIMSAVEKGEVDRYARHPSVLDHLRHRGSAAIVTALLTPLLHALTRKPSEAISAVRASV